MQQKKIINIIEHGYYSKPIVNYILSTTNNNTIRFFLLHLKYLWNNDIEKAYEYAEKVNNLTDKKILRELARLNKIEILILKNDIDNAKKEYTIIKKNLKNLPQYGRRIIVPGLKLLASNFNENKYVIRKWSKKYEKNYAEKCVIKYSEARKYANLGDKIKASRLFLDGYRYAKKFPHPTMMYIGLNNSAWQIKDMNIKKATYIVKQLEYIMGYYFEDLYNIINGFDTSLKIENINNSIDIIDTINIITLLNIKNKILNHSKINKIKKQYNYSKIKKQYLEYNYDILLKSFFNKNYKEITYELFATYSSLIKKPKFNLINAIYLVQNNKKNEITELFKKNIIFLKNLLDPHPFYKARKFLIFQLLKNGRNINELISIYSKLSLKEKIILDIFLRNHIRYDIKWEINPKCNNNLLIQFSKRYNFGKKRSIFAYFYFDEEYRDLLNNILKKFPLQ
ncbi:hypothetical protein [Marinitoga sp. 38H-ov]|uniref:hypothetical protein n=1 Tax=Marinitoga sp. 38H-ov TaxID=1755814 RepID=UPI0013ECFEF0|nr:hypothetical protein [Marinitoga sp. 38H-ov]KAF2955546.1 hypothetical protein AS160_09725 [Marinitoga sp. 38H-ov]